MIQALAILTCLFATAVEAGDPAPALMVELHWTGAALAEPFTVELHAIPQKESDTDPRGASRASVTVPGTADLRLSQGLWWIGATGDDVWAAPQQVHIGEAPRPISLEVWPAGTVKGLIRVPPGDEMPGELLIRFAPVPDPNRKFTQEEIEKGRKDPEKPEGIQRCPISKGSFACHLPATNLDLRLRSEGYVTHYRWGVEILATKVQHLGILKLQPGASLVGWVVTSDGSSLHKTARVELQPWGLASPLAEEQDSRSRLALLEAPINNRGFFHFDGIIPGEYHLTARQEPFGPATAAVTVIAGREAELREPLVLAPPEKLAIIVDPAVDPEGHPWRLRLSRLDPYRNRAEPVVEDEVPVDGWWEREGLSAGAYYCSILRLDGNPWVSRKIRLGEDLLPIRFEIPAVRIEGEISLGGKPLAATLWFGSRFGSEKAEFQSSEEGTFGGLLPRAGAWLVEIEAQEPRVHRTVPNVEVRPAEKGEAAQVVIELPNTVVYVEVVDETGKPVRKAVVHADPMTEHASAGTMEITDDFGFAQLHGLPPGALSLFAKSGHDESEAIVVTVSDDVEIPPVTLTVRKKRTIRGRVVSSAGPVPGARVSMYPASLLTTVVRPVVTGPNGEFEYRLPGTTTEVRFKLVAPGFSYRMGRAKIPEDGWLELEASQAGGTLEMAAVKVPRFSAFQPVLFHNGATAPWYQLKGLASSQGERGGSEHLVVPDMEAGNYSFCWTPTSATPSAAGPTAALCASGDLQPFGSLSLILPPYPGDDVDRTDQ